MAMDRDFAMIAVVHRLSTIIDADRIYAMEDDRVVEEGTHEDPIDQGDHYAELYRLALTTSMCLRPCSERSRRKWMPAGICVVKPASSFSLFHSGDSKKAWPPSQSQTLSMA